MSSSLLQPFQHRCASSSSSAPTSSRAAHQGNPYLQHPQPLYGSSRIADGPSVHIKSNDASALLHIDDAIEMLGMGRFQYQILVAAGLCFMADSMEVLLLSFLATIVKDQWGLSNTQVSTIISVVFAGALLGTLILSSLGDIIGRKSTFTATAGLIAIFGLATAFCKTYAQLVAVRFLVGFGVGGLTVPFDTLSEMLPTKCRGKNLLYIEFFWVLGSLSVPFVAYLTLDTRNSTGDSGWPVFVIVCSIPCILSTILGIILVPESPRWLLEHNPTPQRCQQALVTLRNAAVLNGHDPLTLFPEGTHLTAENVHEKHHSEDDIIYSSQSNKAKKKRHDHTNSLTELLSPAWRKITFLLWGAWFGLGFLYYGVILAVSVVFTVDGTEEDQADQHQQQFYDDEDDTQSAIETAYDFDYSAIVISASAEIFGLVAVILTVDSWGRINTQTLSYIAGGIACLLLGFGANYDFPRPMLILLAFLSRMAMMGSTCTTWVSTSEILVTEIRATGHGAANAMARLGGFLCPYFIMGSNSPASIGIGVFLLAMLTSACTWHLPETAGKAMGDVLDDFDNKDMDSEKATKSSDVQPAKTYQII